MLDESQVECPLGSMYLTGLLLTCRAFLQRRLRRRAAQTGAAYAYGRCSARARVWSPGLCLSDRVRVWAASSSPSVCLVSSPGPGPRRRVRVCASRSRTRLARPRRSAGASDRACLAAQPRPCPHSLFSPRRCTPGGRLPCGRLSRSVYQGQDVGADRQSSERRSTA